MQQAKPKLTLSILIRSVIFNILLICSIIIGGFTLGIFSIILPYSIKYRLLTSWAKVPVVLAKFICNVRYKVINEDKIPNHPCIVISNHQSAWETFFYPGLFPKQCWVIKKQLLNIPIWGWVFRMLKPIAIDRQKKLSIQTLLDQGLDRIEQGIWIIIFPEGTRLGPGIVGKYSRSGAVLAEKAQIPILPVVHNAGICWPRASFILHPGTITVHIGDEILLDQGTAAQVNQQIEKWTRDTLAGIETKH